MQYEKLKKVKENFSDINYYGDSVMYWVEFSFKDSITLKSNKTYIK